MVGTKEGGKKAAITNRLKHGDGFYAEIGRIGGKNGTTGGFAYDREVARRAGSIGGRRSKKGMKLISNTDGVLRYRNNKTGEIVEVENGRL